MAVNVSFDLESFARSIRQSGYLSLRNAARALTRMYDETLAPLGLRATQLGMLRVCAASGPLSIVELSRELQATLRMVQRDIRPLLETGLVVKERPAGQGQARIRLTPAGRRQLLAGIQRWDFVQSRLIEVLGEDRWKVLQQQLDALSEADA
jgi:DNA-binding MarR family transcriptional regulator